MPNVGLFNWFLSLALHFLVSQHNNLGDKIYTKDAKPTNFWELNYTVRVYFFNTSLFFFNTAVHGGGLLMRVAAWRSTISLILPGRENTLNIHTNWRDVKSANFSQLKIIQIKA